jgi:hypothetical protein
LSGDPTMNCVLLGFADETEVLLAYRQQCTEAHWKYVVDLVSCLDFGRDFGYIMQGVETTFFRVIVFR